MEKVENCRKMLSISSIMSSGITSSRSNNDLYGKKSEFENIITF